ncbi:MAG: hypothetical protein WCH39_07670, partial [Schlesneria sp.]
RLSTHRELQAEKLQLAELSRSNSRCIDSLDSLSETPFSLRIALWKSNGNDARAQDRKSLSSF